jgi:HK97 family phage portal protein
VALLSDSIATLPIVTYQKSNTGKGTIPSPPLIDDPWPEGSQADWISQVVMSMAVRGKFYGLITARDDSGYPTMIKPYHPDSVTSRRDLNGVRQYWYDGKAVPTVNVLHIPNILMPGAYIGLNPVEYARQSWGIAAAAAKYGGQFFANSATPSGLIEVGEDLSPEETLELARAWKESHGGLGNAGLPAVLTGGATFKPLSLNPDDAQFIATRQYEDTQIMGFFRIPPHMMGAVDRSPQATDIESVEMAFVTNTLMPYLVKIESRLSRLLPQGIEAKFDVSARLRANMQARFTNYTLGVNNGVISVNEARKMEGLDPIGADGDEFWRPLNFAPVSQIMSGQVSFNPANGGQGGGLDQHPDGGGTPPNPPNNPKAPVAGSP